MESLSPFIPISTVIRIKALDILYFVLMIVGFVISFVAKVAAAVWYYISWSMYIEGEIRPGELTERFNLVYLLNTVSEVGLLIMFVVICLLIFELMRSKDMNLLIARESQPSPPPPIEQVGQDPYAEDKGSRDSGPSPNPIDQEAYEEGII